MWRGKLDEIIENAQNPLSFRRCTVVFKHSQHGRQQRFKVRHDCIAALGEQRMPHVRYTPNDGRFRLDFITKRSIGFLIVIGLVGAQLACFVTFFEMFREQCGHQIANCIHAIDIHSHSAQFQYAFS